VAARCANPDDNAIKAHEMASATKHLIDAIISDGLAEPIRRAVRRRGARDDVSRFVTPRTIW
jgi:hypothetical protein